MSGSNLLGYHPILGSTSTSASNNNVSGVEYLLNNGGLDKVMVENLKKLEPEDRTRCLQCSKASVVALVKQYANEISCSGCVRTLLSTLNGSLFENQSSHSHSKSTGILSAIISEVDNDGGFRLRPQWESSIETVGKLFKVFNDSSYLSRRSNNGKRHRCSLHAVSSRVDIDCESLWRDMPLYLRKRTACLRVEELTEALSKHLKNLYFCRDCRGNVQRALEILISNADVEDADIDDSFCEEYFVPFQLESRDDDYFTDEDEQEYVTHSLDLDHDHDHDHEHNPSHDHYHDNCAECGDGHDEFQHEHHENECDEDCDCEYLDDDEHDDDEVFMDDHHHHNGKCCYEGADCELIGQPSHVSCALRQVPHLIRRAVEADERDEVARAKGQSSDRHAPTLKEGQSELLNCIGKLLQTRMRDSWIMHLVKRQTDEILLWLILSCMRTNVERVIQYNVGNEALISLLEEEADNIKKSKKKKKKKKKKGKKSQDSNNGGIVFEKGNPNIEEPVDVDTASQNMNSDNLKADQCTCGESANGKMGLCTVCSSKVASSSSPAYNTSSPISISAQAESISGSSSSSCDSSCQNNHGGENKLQSISCTSPTVSFFPTFSDQSMRLKIVSGGDENRVEDAEGCDSDDGGLTAEELREAREQLKAMMSKNSREDLRANLRKNFETLCGQMDQNIFC
eukprot:CAMPEP_0204836106 /NCGR_PEP_ID=MMETSP1346-20131115/24254_1 /ASSEMBLY_ACC=CAM_ASM_000771 /TAXON_ID=215587 /ORGANISM="Aplanochytrium stocchinoi, Strain GSBS06" /LENGTH=682 /DNA_ID=CAMNT_0051970577 /DNA_START=338 /DNA_END=2386 /DNA_ORIENTATION=+